MFRFEIKIEYHFNYMKNTKQLLLRVWATPQLHSFLEVDDGLGSLDWGTIVVYRVEILVQLMSYLQAMLSSFVTLLFFFPYSS